MNVIGSNNVDLYQAKTKPGGCKTSSYCVGRIGRFHPIAQKQKNHLNIPFVLERPGHVTLRQRRSKAAQEISLRLLGWITRRGSLVSRAAWPFLVPCLGLAAANNRLAVKPATQLTKPTKYNEHFLPPSPTSRLLKISLEFWVNVKTFKL